MKKLFLLFAMFAFIASGCETLPENLDQLPNEEPEQETPETPNTPNIDEIVVDLTAPDATMSDVPSNEIWYIATEKVTPKFESAVSSNDYDPNTGKGVINFLEDLTVVDASAFAGCESLLSVTLPNSITEIQSEAFYNCTSLKGIIIPEGVGIVGESAFGGCTNLQKITIGYDVWEIGDFAFNGCESLEAVYMMCKSAPMIASEVFNGEQLKIYVDTDQVDTYKGHEQWNAYADIIEGYAYPSLMTLINLGDSVSDPELKMGTYRDDFFAPLYGKPAGSVVRVEMYQRTLDKHLGRDIYYMKNLFSEENIFSIIGDTPLDMSYASGDTYILIDARDPESVYIPFQSTGVGIAGWMGNVGIASGASIGAENAVLENGIINFAANTVGLLDYNTGTGMYANQSGFMRITLPGVYIPDYSIGVSYVGVDDDQALFNFVLGRDVAEYRFVVVEGNQPICREVKEGTGLNQITRIYLNEAIENMVNSGIYDICSPASQTEWRVSLPNAAVYTIFAVAYNSNGEPIYTDGHEYDNIARTHFYFSTEDSEDAIPDIHPETLTLRLDTVAAIMGEDYPYAESYPGYNILLLEMVSAEDYMDYVVGLKLYYDTTANIEQAKADGVTMDTLFASDQAEDITDRIVDIKQGNGMMLLKDLISDTSYTAIIEVSSIYGKKHYYEATGSTEKQL
ncbi:MAG: leucine-rich repeat domain-containing protein [Alistipes sp.]|nr:leucine-rich repeat domain-containing protein [Alistipes sp.]